LGGSGEEGFLIWGRVNDASSALPKKKLTPKVSNMIKLRPPTAPDPTAESMTPYPLQEVEEDADELLNHFSGEPQIVNDLTVSQLTYALPRAPADPSMSTQAVHTPSITTTTDSFKLRGGYYLTSL
jgi:hypothetical protein